MTYQITDYSFHQAKLLNVEIKPSTNKKKKIDVFKDGQKIASIGSIFYKDFPTYISEKGLDYAYERRRLYRIRHKNDLNSINGYYASRILW